MSRFYRHSLFPYIIIGLTLALGVFIYQTVQDVSSNPAKTEPVEVIDESAYQQEMREILSGFFEEVEASDQLDRLVAIESAKFSLLNIRVPAQYKEVHLDLVILLTNMEQRLKTDQDRNIDSNIQEIRNLISQHEWLAPAL